jgi:hypothetical protein
MINDLISYLQSALKAPTSTYLLDRPASTFIPLDDYEDNDRTTKMAGVPNLSIMDVPVHPVRVTLSTIASNSRSPCKEKANSSISLATTFCQQSI